ncbi:MAG TPA: hypothetical protein VMU40_18985, partial [Steroidobacteraceae bacterium]|nr:hypothetical protein [Steroidobacteraceae bacterium]
MRSPRTSQWRIRGLRLVVESVHPDPQAYRRLICSASTLSAVHEGIHTPREVASEPFEPGIDLGEF